MLIKFFLPRLPFGHVFEFGTYKAGTALFMASLAAKYLPGAVVYALDTFEGMPATDKSIDTHGQGNFDDTSLEAVEATRIQAGLTNLRFVKGIFADTAEATLAKAGRRSSSAIQEDRLELSP
jgi:Macrocin-O-methyltransferase (TylF)